MVLNNFFVFRVNPDHQEVRQESRGSGGIFDECRPRPRDRHHGQSAQAPAPTGEVSLEKTHRSRALSLDVRNRHDDVLRHREKGDRGQEEFDAGGDWGMWRACSEDPVFARRATVAYNAGLLCARLR